MPTRRTLPTPVSMAILPSAVADAAADMVPLHGELFHDKAIYVNAADAAVDLDGGTKLGGYRYRDRPRPGIDLESVDVGEELQLHRPGSGVDLDFGRRDTLQVHTAGAGVHEQATGMQPASAHAPRSGIDLDIAAIPQVFDLDVSRPGVELDFFASTMVLDVDTSRSGIDAQVSTHGAHPHLPRAGVDGKGAGHVFRRHGPHSCADFQVAADTARVDGASSKVGRCALPGRQLDHQVGPGFDSVSGTPDGDPVSSLASI